MDLRKGEAPKTNVTPRESHGLLAFVREQNAGPRTQQRSVYVDGVEDVMCRMFSLSLFSWSQSRSPAVRKKTEAAAGPVDVEDATGAHRAGFGVSSNTHGELNV